MASYGSLKFIEYLTCIEIVKDLIKPYKGQLILDAGCGDGMFCYEYVMSYAIHKSFWSDVGTFDSLLRASEFIKMIDKKSKR